MKTKLKFIIPVILLIVLILCITARQSDNNAIPAVIVSESDIDRIEIEKGEYLFGYKSNYVIDFKTNTYTAVYSDSYSEDNEEYIGHFSDEAKENFVSLANKYGFFSWQESYVNLNVEDGGYTDFLIIYNDGSQHKTNCSNAYPDTYDAVWEAIRELRKNSYEN